MKIESYLRDGYFEAILQIRPYDKEVIDYIINEIKKKDKVLLSKLVELKTGMDLYITSYRFAVSLGKEIKKRFPGELKISKLLFSQNRQTSKPVYRVTVLFRLKDNLYK